MQGNRIEKNKRSFRPEPRGSELAEGRRRASGRSAATVSGCKGQVWVFEEEIEEDDEFADDGGEGDFAGHLSLPRRTAAHAPLRLRTGHIVESKDLTLLLRPVGTPQLGLVPKLRLGMPCGRSCALHGGGVGGQATVRHHCGANHSHRAKRSFGELAFPSAAWERVPEKFLTDHFRLGVLAP